MRPKLSQISFEKNKNVKKSKEKLNFLNVK
jgi:hypothetical protein